MEHINTMNRIQALFERKQENILSVFYTAGFPSRNDTVQIAQQLEASGVDLLEIGIPFSDPLADGPVIQASSKTAIDNGMTVKLLLEQVKEIRTTVQLPILLMGYINPVMQYGIEKFFRDSASAGVDGFIFPDMPFDEYEVHYKELLEELKLSFVFLISPTTSEERIRKIDEASAGFIYAVSTSSTTGARKGFQPEQLTYFKKLKEMNLKNPFLIGFGISDKATFAEANEYGAGCIIGSAFITMLQTSTNLEADIYSFINSLKP
jgi:tryptophan synthase alpha chain